MVNKKKFKKIIIIIVLILLIFLIGKIIQIAISRYQTDTQVGTDNIDSAVIIVEPNFNSTSKVLVEDLLPSDNFRNDNKYVLSVSNFDYVNNKRLEAAVNYKIRIKTTTNMPLEFQVKNNGDLCTSFEESIIQEDGAYYHVIDYLGIEEDEKFFLGITEDETDVFELFVRLPKGSDTMDYMDLVDSVEIGVISEQYIEES